MMEKTDIATADPASFELNWSVNAFAIVPVICFCLL